MLSNLRITGKYDIPVINGKIKVNDEILSLKEIPFVRYNFVKYTEDDIEYINTIIEKFNSSVHLIEYQLTENTLLEMGLIDNEDIVRYLFISITDDNVVSIGEHNKSLLGDVLSKEYINRIMLIDNSTTLNRTNILKLKDEIMAINKSVNNDMIGVCGSPFSIGDESCLSALRARQLLTDYSENDECAIPSARHECMDCCSCIRHIVIDDNTIFNTKSSKINSQKKIEKAESQKKQVKKTGTILIDW